MSSRTSGPGHRPDIDGLRAIAVLGVVAFHLQIDALAGGFIGVDVFFVISGYLITGMILGSTINGSFSITTFYLRRSMRLLPALAVTVLFCLLAGYWLFSPGDLARLGEAAVASITATSNIFFWQQAGYFDSQLSAKPLLHTWTLSLEWQFYLLWPLMVYFIARRAIRSLLITFLVTIWVLSFVGLQWMMEVDSTAAFFLLPFRIFEFATGGLAAVLAGGKHCFRQSVRTVLSLAGFAMIIAAMLVLSPHSAFPGYWVLLPTIGTALLLAFPAPLIVHLLSRRPLELIGLWSYSIYLVHWPLISFYQYWTYRELTNLEQTLLAALSVIVAIPLYYAIEQPLRVKDVRRITAAGNTRFRAATTLLFAAASIFAGILITRNAGFPERVDQQYEHPFYGHLPCGTLGDRSSLVMVECRFGTNVSGKILLIGDSHSRQFAHGLNTSPISTRYAIESYFSGRCAPMSTRSRVRNGTLDQDCETAKRRISRALARADYDLVLMSLRWVVYEPRITLAEIAELAGLTGGAPLMIIGPTPYPENKRPCDRPTAFGSNPCGSFLPTEDDLDENRRITAIASTLGLPYVDLFQAGCGLRGCLLYEENTALYADATHLSTHGSDFYVARVEPRILSALAWSKSNRTLGSTAW